MPCIRPRVSPSSASCAAPPPIAGREFELRDGSSLAIDLFVVLIAGHSVQRVGAEIQQRVADAVERMLGLSVQRIDVHISEVVFAA